MLDREPEEVFELKQRLKAIELGARTPTGAAGPTVTSQKVPTRESAGRSSSTNDEGSTKLGENAALLRRGLEMEPPKRSSIDPPPTDAEISSMASFPRPGKQKDRVKQIRKAITDGPGRGPLTDSDYGRIVQLVRQVYKMVFLEGRGLVQPHHDLAVAFLEHKVPALRNCAEHWQAETLLANRIKSATVSTRSGGWNSSGGLIGLCWLVYSQDRLLSKHDSVTEPGSTSRRSTTRTPKHESASKLGLDGAAGMAVAGELSSLEVDPVVQGEDSGGTRLLGSALSPSRRSRSSLLSSPPSSPEARSPAGDRMKRRWSLAELDEEPDAEEDLGDDIPSRGQPIQYVPRRTRGTKRKVAFTRTTETDEATVPASESSWKVGCRHGQDTHHRVDALSCREATSLGDEPGHEAPPKSLRPARPVHADREVQLGRVLRGILRRTCEQTSRRELFCT